MDGAVLTRRLGRRRARVERRARRCSRYAKDAKDASAAVAVHGGASATDLHRDGRAVANGDVAEEFAGGRLDEDERGGDETRVDDDRAEEDATSEMFAAKRDDGTAAERSHVRRRREDERGLGDAPLGRGRIERRRLFGVEVLEGRGGGVRVAERRRENVDDASTRRERRMTVSESIVRADTGPSVPNRHVATAELEIAGDANGAAVDRDERVGFHGVNDGGVRVRERHALGERHRADAFDGRRLDEDERG